MKSCIYDFETLSQDVFDGVVVNLATLMFDESRFLERPYEFEDLVNDCKLIKFDVQEQVKVYGRKIQQGTLDWWASQGSDAQKLLKPSEDDVSISELHSFLIQETRIQEAERVYTRGNAFDPVLLQSVLRHFNQKEPYDWWKLRDTRSLFDGMLYGSNINNKFIPPGIKEKFIAHDSCHDIAMDVMRYQTLVRMLNEDTEEV